MIIYSGSHDASGGFADGNWRPDFLWPQPSLWLLVQQAYGPIGGALPTLKMKGQEWGLHQPVSHPQNAVVWLEVGFHPSHMGGSKEVRKAKMNFGQGFWTRILDKDWAGHLSHQGGHSGFGFLHELRVSVWCILARGGLVIEACLAFQFNSHNWVDAALRR